MALMKELKEMGIDDELDGDNGGDDGGGGCGDVGGDVGCADGDNGGDNGDVGGDGVDMDDENEKRFDEKCQKDGKEKKNSKKADQTPTESSSKPLNQQVFSKLCSVQTNPIFNSSCTRLFQFKTLFSV